MIEKTASPEKKSATTLYNHVTIGTASKPLMPNVIYKGFLFLLDTKDFESCDYLEKSYSLTEHQLTLYNSKKQDLQNGNRIPENKG